VFCRIKLSPQTRSRCVTPVDNYSGRINIAVHILWRHTGWVTTVFVYFVESTCHRTRLYFEVPLAECRCVRFVVSNCQRARVYFAMPLAKCRCVRFVESTCHRTRVYFAAPLVKCRCVRFVESACHRRTLMLRHPGGELLLYVLEHQPITADICSLCGTPVCEYSRTPLIRTLVIRIGVALPENLSRILQN